MPSKRLHYYPTVTDVAREAGVSSATVSRVLNRPYLVHESTRERVLKAMEACGYVTNALARGLSSRRTFTVGIIIPTITNPIFASSTGGAQEVFQHHGYTLFMGATDYDRDQEARLIRSFMEQQVDGLILTGYERDPGLYEDLSRRNFPFIVTWTIVEDGRVPFIGFDNHRSAYRMTDYLADLGHQRIGMICGEPTKSDRARQRLEGYRHCLEDRGIPFPQELVIKRPYTFLDGKEAVWRMLALSPPPTAIFCANDILAIGAVHGIQEHGLDVPGDISVAGFDDLGFASYISPPLTTVRVPAREMGQRSAEALLEAIREGSLVAAHYVLDTDIIIRRSTAPPARGHELKLENAEASAKSIGVQSKV